MIFPFPAVLQLYGRIAFGDGELCEPTMHFHTQFSPININTADTPGCRSQFAISEGDAYAHKYTAGINKLRLWASLVNPYCAKHDLPSPTDSQLPFPNFQHTVSDGIPNFQHTVSDGFKLPVPDFQHTVSDGIPGFRIPIYSSRVSNTVSSGRGV